MTCTIVFIFICFVHFRMSMSVFEDTQQSTGNDENRSEITNSSNVAMHKRINDYYLNEHNNYLFNIYNDSDNYDYLSTSNVNFSLSNSSIKIDYLAKLLKFQIDEFFHRKHQLEIVFLIDASSSVGIDNFNDEINFVSKLLRDLDVDESSIRIAIITFAGKNMIYRAIDQITDKLAVMNKCYLLNEGLKNITWTGGGTYTRGALLEALDILQNGQIDAQKVVFLITDGFSNGGDPRPIAKMLKDIGTIIVTFGIRTGNVKELNDIASEPGNYHSYFLNSFAEFSAVARRALHRDVRPEKYVKMITHHSCNALCNASLLHDKLNEQCCDNFADCTCGTTSGHYACMCLQGYFGSGLRGACHVCPNGTYGNPINPSNSTLSCVPCSNPNHVTLKIPATAPSDCVCASGFTGNSSQCHPITCPKLQLPENGYLVKANACGNVFNAACGLRCKIGFKLAGDSIRLCLKNGSWSGVKTQCLLKTCPAPRPPANGVVHCKVDIEYNESSVNGLEDSSALPIDAQCQFKCDHGFQMLGSKIRNCLPVSRWDGLQVSCKQIKCDPLPPLANGKINPLECTNSKKLAFGTSCTVRCNSGFSLQGPNVRKCIGSRGLWSKRRVVNRCIDNTPPTITCPDNATWSTVSGRSYALPTWTIPTATDNYDEDIPIWSKPHIIFPWKSKIGSHIITYIAEDSAGNRARCRFTIKTIDIESPTIDNCINPPVFLSVHHEGAVNVTWDEPIFHDNSGKKLQITRSHRQGDFFKFGLTKIIYSATDKSNNSAVCVLNITVENACNNIPMLVNGHGNCRNNLSSGDVRCVFTCEDGYALPLYNSALDNFDNNLILDCKTELSGWNTSQIADCAPVEIPNSLKINSNVILDSESPLCENSPTLQRLKSLLAEHLPENLERLCFSNGVECQLPAVDVNCDANDESRGRRNSDNEEEWLKKQKIRGKKRRKNKIEIKLEFIGRIIRQYQNDSVQGIQKLRDELQMLTSTGKLDLFNEQTHKEIGKLALNINAIFSNVQSICKPGQIVKKDKCVKCPAGTFANSTRHCTPCPLGEYQNLSGSTSCKFCSQGFSTKKIHSKNIRDCILICQPGYYSKIRHYITQKLALMPCYACEVGYYQPYAGERHCLPCPGNSTTSDRGSTSLRDCYHHESCPHNACFNDGRCIVESAGYSCECKKGFVGSRCEFIRNPCDSSPCLSGGHCYDNSSTSSKFTCSCRPDYTGPNCEIFIDECLSQPCVNNGTCISNENDYHCRCPDNFGGEYCEESLNLCSNVCEEGSTCVIVDGEWKCLCKPGFLGRRCQYVPCDWLPCNLNAICINIEESNTTHSSYRCECPDGYQGDNCSIPINYCDSLPCQNGGTCLNYQNHFVCTCSNTFDGGNCEIKLRSDYLLYFDKPTTTDYALLDGPKQNLTSFTLCFWIQSLDSTHYGTIFSYADENNDNLITLTDYSGLVFYINSKRIITDIRLNDGLWHFTCVSWENTNGSWFIYVDGIVEESGMNLEVNETIAANGSVIIGQEQDYLGGGFSLSEAFIGRLTLLDMWNVVMSNEFIISIQDMCTEYFGNLISWSSVQKAIRGDVKMLPNYFCNGCGNLDNPLNGFLNVTSNSLAIYTCEPGYKLKINPRIIANTEVIRHCLKSGNWNGSSPVCVKIVCGYPGYFPRGKIQGSSFSFDDSVEYKCDDGYEMRGKPLRTCKSDGTWSGIPPLCVGITCKNLLAPENGDIEYIVDEFERDDVTIVQVGQQLEFKCNSGFQLVGENILTCRETGLWNYPSPSCVLLQCFATANTSGDGNRNSTCNVTCGKPPKIPNANPNESDGKITKFFTQRGYYYYSVGQKIVYKCLPGFRFYGNNSTKCLPTGKWSRIHGKCTKISCGKPGVPENVVLTGKSYLFEAMLNFTCLESQITGSITCNADGNWSYLPDCIG